MTITQIQGHLKQLLELNDNLTTEQRYSINAAMEAMELLSRIAPGISKVISQFKK